MKFQRQHYSQNEYSTYVNDDEINIILYLNNKEYLTQLINLINKYSWKKNTNEQNYIDNIKEIMTHPKIGIKNFIDELNIINAYFKKYTKSKIIYKFNKQYINN